MVKQIYLFMVLFLFNTLIIDAQWNYQGPFPDTSKIWKSQTHSLTVDPEGKIWVGKFSNISGFIDPATGKALRAACYLTYVFNPNGTQAPFSPIFQVMGDTMYNTTQRGMRTNIDGNILLSTGKPALYLIDYKTGKGLKKVVLPAFPTASCVSKDGTIFIAPVSPGAFPLQMYNQNLEFVGNALDKTVGFSRSFEVSQDGNTIYWAGYTQGTIYIYNRTDKTAPFALKDSMLTGMRAESFTWHSKTGNLWISAGSNNDKPFNGYSMGTWYAYNFFQKKVVDSIKWNYNLPLKPDERPRALGFSPDGNTAYIGQFGTVYGMVQKFVKSGPYLYPPILHLPQKDSQINSIPIVLKWNKVKEAKKYFLQVSLKSDFSETIISDSTLTDTLKQISSVQYLKEYYWRVLAKNDSLRSFWSETWSFKTGDISDTYWSLSIDVSSENRNDLKTVVIGQHPSGSDSVDPILGEYLVPPIPPSGIADLRLELPNGLHTIKDFRNISEKTITWKIIFQAGESGFPLKLEWDSNTLPKGIFIIKDAITGQVINTNMKQANSLTITNPSIKQLVITYCFAVDINAFYENGWNLVSSPVKIINVEIKDIFPTALSYLYAYNNGYNICNTIEYGSGYWIKLNNALNVTYMGEEVKESITLKSGWNLIGVADKKIAVNKIITAPINITTSSFYSYNNGYQIADTLYPGQGYWIKTNAGGEILPIQSLGKRMEREVISSNWSSIDFTDSEGEVRKLYLAKESINQEEYEMPPMAPKGITDIRFANGTFAADIRRIQSVQIQCVNYPIRIKSNGEELIIRYTSSSGVIEERISKSSEFVLRDKSITSIEISADIIPIEFALLQNYPNPFNPSTKIKFAIPNNGITKLTIYNSLGEKVEELINREMEAGYHEVTWNASKFSSGVYFYEILNNKTRLIKKMMLIK